MSPTIYSKLIFLLLACGCTVPSLQSQTPVTYYTYEASSVNSAMDTFTLDFNNIDHVHISNGKMVFSFSGFKRSNVESVRFDYQLTPAEWFDNCKFSLLFSTLNSNPKEILFGNSGQYVLRDIYKSTTINLNEIFNSLNVNEFWVYLNPDDCIKNSFNLYPFYFSRKLNTINLGPITISTRESKENFYRYNHIFPSKESEAIISRMNPDIGGKDSVLSNHPYAYVEIPKLNEAQKPVARQQLKVASAYNKASVSKVNANLQRVYYLSDSLSLFLKTYKGKNSESLHRLMATVDSCRLLGKDLLRKKTKMRHASTVYLNSEMEFIQQNLNKFIRDNSKIHKDSLQHVQEVATDLNNELRIMKAYYERKKSGLAPKTGMNENLQYENGLCSVEQEDLLILNATSSWSDQATEYSLSPPPPSGSYSNAVVQLLVSNYDCNPECSNTPGTPLKATLVPYGFRFDSNIDTQRNRMESNLVRTSPACASVGIGKYYLRLFNNETKKEIEFEFSDSHVIDLTQTSQITVTNTKWSLNYIVTVKILH